MEGARAAPEAVDAHMACPRRARTHSVPAHVACPCCASSATLASPLGPPLCVALTVRAVLNTEYVGTLDFKLDAGDQNFLWNKGYITTMLWLQKRSKKAKDKKKKVAKGLAKELIKEASKIKLSAEGASKQAPAPVDGAAKLQGTSAAPSQGSDSGANLELSAQPSEDGGFDPVAGLKGRVSKILSNKTLHSDEKLDIITKLLAQPTPHSTTS